MNVVDNDNRFHMNAGRHQVQSVSIIWPLAADIVLGVD